MFEYLACYCTCDVKLFGSLPVPVDADPLGRPGSGVQREVVSKLGPQYPDLGSPRLRDWAHLGLCVVGPHRALGT